MIVGPRTSSSPSAAERDFDARERLADRADPDRVLWVCCRDQRRLAHAPDLADRQSERGEELEHLGCDRRRSGAQVLGLIEAELSAQLREDRRVGALARLTQLAATGAPACSARTTAVAARTASATAARRCSSGSAAKPASSAVLSLSHTRGTAPHTVGRTSISAAPHLRDVADERDRRARDRCWRTASRSGRRDGPSAGRRSPVLRV